MHSADDEEQVVKKSPIETAKLSPSAALPVVVEIKSIEIKWSSLHPVTSGLSSSILTPRTASTYAIPLSVVVHVVVTISSIEIEKSPFQPVADTLLPSAAVPADLSSIYVPSKPYPGTTYCIIPRVHIEQIDYINAMCYSNGYH